MAYQRQYAADAIGRQAAALSAVASAAKKQSAAFVIPIVDDDPATGDPTNMWAFDDGRIRFRGTDGTIHELVPHVDQGYKIPTVSSTPAASTGIDFWVGTTGIFHVRLANGAVMSYSPDSAGSSTTGGGSSTGSGTSGTPKQQQYVPKTYRRTWSPTWGRTLCPVHGVETGSELYYGRWSSTHGKRRIMLGFDDANIRSALSGASIKKVELHMVNTHAYSNSGIYVHWSAHNRSSAPGSYSSVRENFYTGHWPKSGDGAYWRSIPTWFGRALRDNSAKGLGINQTSDSVSLYGAMADASVRLRITYVK